MKKGTAGRGVIREDYMVSYSTSRLGGHEPFLPRRMDRCKVATGAP